MNERLRITKDGYVGIGTDNPNYLLDVYKSTGTNQDVFSVRGQTSAFLVQCSDLSAANPTWNLRSFAAEDITLKPGNSESVRFKADGKVGIGTDNPASPLHIGQSTDNSVTAGITLKNNPSIGAQRFTLYNEEDVGTHYNSNDGGTGRAHIFESGGTERLRILSDGKVGIGTDNPEYQTTIAADGANAKLNIKRKTAAASNGNAFGSLFYTNSDGTDVASIRAHRESANDDAYLGFATRNTGGSLSERFSITGFGTCRIPDDGKLTLGTGDDLQIEHKSNGDSAIIEAGTGALYIGSSEVRISPSYTTQYMGRFVSTAEVALYYNNSKKFETTGIGISVSGSIEVTQEYPSIRPTLDLNFAATKTLDRRITFTRDSIGTYTDELGIVRTAPNNTPRFDYDPTTRESLGLLIEESRINLFTYSEEFNQSGWSNVRSSDSGTTATADPEGNTTGAAYKLVPILIIILID